MKGKIGRPSLLTDETSQKILKDVEDGAYISTACIAAGISRQTFYNWLGWAEEGKEPYSTFFDAFKKREAQAEIDKMRDMLKGGKDFLPCATFLERRFRDKWGRSDRLAVTADVHQVIEITNFARHEVIEVNPVSSKAIGPPKDITPSNEESDR